MNPTTTPDSPTPDSLIGKTVSFEHDETTGNITKETETHFYVESDFYTGWIPKTALQEEV